MFPPKNPQMPPQGQQPQQPPQPSQPPQGGAAPPQGAPAQDGGPLAFNQGIFQILVARIHSLTPQDQQILDSLLTPQTTPVLLKMLPELKPILAVMMKQAQQPGPIGQPGQPPAGQAPPSPAGAPAGGPPAPGGAPSAAQPGGQPGQQEPDDDEESDNPLVQAPASNGLIG